MLHLLSPSSSPMLPLASLSALENILHGVGAVGGFRSAAPRGTRAAYPISLLLRGRLLHHA